MQQMDGAHCIRVRSVMVRMAIFSSSFCDKWVGGQLLCKDKLIQ